jgi:hypothetical protein
MKTLLLLFAALCGAWCAAPATAADDTRLWAYKYVLATSVHPREFATILNHLKKQPQLRQPELVDYLAEALLGIKDQRERADIELKELLVNALNQYGGERYVGVMQELQKAGGSGNDARRIVDAYVKEYQKTKVEQYVPGTVNFPALREKFSAEAFAAQPTEEQALKMAQLPVNASPDTLVSLIGRPQYIGSGQLRVGERILIDVHIQRMTFFYRGLGKVTFQYDDDTGWIARDREVDPEAFEDLMPYRAHAAELGLPSDEAVGFAQLLSGHSQAIKVAAESRTRHGGATPQLLDAAAEVLLATHTTVVEPRMVDAHAWICRLLQHYGGPRYSNVLATVAAGAVSEKLQKFAKLKFEDTAPKTGEPYVPGSVSLTELRAKYPPLYPQRTLTSSSWH